ncbi:MAG: carboxypeptidase regulatory-like domain-containing protein [Deltaproteobacteria bacterium]|nr:carboxypeptidase regulatory-like domain-containing protein [Deltaproteobacteria bacterium]
MSKRVLVFLVAWSSLFGSCGEDDQAAGGGEICSNQADDDGDGFVDCLDQDCWRHASCGDASAGDATADGSATDASGLDAEATTATETTAATDTTTSDTTTGCDPCGDLGQIKGRVCSPSQHVYVGGANVVVEGTGCDGQAFRKETTSANDGTYWLLDVPCGQHTITITKGSFAAEHPIAVAGGQITDVTGAAQKLCLEAARTRIAVIDGSWDDLEGLLAQLGLGYDLYNDDGDDGAVGTTVGLLSDPQTLAGYDILFVNCGATAGWMPQEHPEVMGNVKEFVVRGGSLYMSDYAWVFGEHAFPDAVEWLNDDDPTGMGKTDTSPQQIPSGTVSNAVVVDGALAAVLGKSQIRIVFDQGPQIAPLSVGAGTFAHVVGDIDVPLDFSIDDAPLALSYVPAQGAGRVIYTNFHNDAQTTSDMLAILNYLVFTL